MELETGAVALWNRNESDAAARQALRVIAVLRERGFVGTDALRAFQTAEGLEATGRVNGDTLDRLGLPR